MEERVPPSSDDPTFLSLTLPPPAAREGSEAYVIQIPRDQVFRVPPPENATIVESYRHPEQSKKKCAGTPCCWICIALVILTIAIGITAATVRAMYNPKSPEFSIVKFETKNSRNLTLPTEYKLMLKSGNPNKRMQVSYNGDGIGSLQFEQHDIAKGGVPFSTQEPTSSRDYALVLNGSKLKVSDEIAEKLDGSSAKAMQLKIEVKMEVKSWAKTARKNLIVTCDFKVDSLKKKPKILSEKCETDF